MNAGLSRKQPVLLGFLALVFAFVLYSNVTSGESEPIESGFDASVLIEETTVETVPSLVQGWEPAALPRNPFEGPYTAGSENRIGGSRNEQEIADGDAEIGDVEDEVIVTEEDFGEGPPSLGFDPDDESEQGEVVAE